jgi:pimeloyl-ACP methyl ester carboxylesterase
VPLDWDHPNGRTIHLAVIRHLASKPKQRIGSMLINPGGPGDTGVGLVQGLGDDIDKWGGGRFNVVSWDPRGTNASTHVRCFRSRRGEARFWKGASIPITTAASERYRRKTVALARRCGKVSGWLLPHISTADTARDLDHLRRLVGDRKLTYVGLSYGTYLGQTYANMFPDRVRAMLIDGVVDPVPYSKGAEARVANQAGDPDEVFAELLSLCETAGPQRCALAGHSRSPAEGVNRLFARAKRAPIPAPTASPPGKLTYSDLIVSQFNPLRVPETWPDDAKDLDAAVGGDGSALATEARKFADAGRLRGGDDVGGDLLRRRAGPQGVAELAAGDRPAHAGQPRLWDAPGLVVVGPVCLLAGARPGQLPGTVECDDEEPDPADRHPARPRHALCQRGAIRAATRKRCPAHLRRLRPRELPRSQRLRRPGAGRLPGQADHPAEGHRLQVGQEALRSGLRRGAVRAGR